MTHPGRTSTTAVLDAFARRSGPTQSLHGEAAAVVRACADMAERFRRGGALLALGSGPAATDAQHVAVEFVHPVLVGKRALPSRYLSDPGQLPVLTGADDIILVIAPGDLGDDLRTALRDARGRGLLTVALVGADTPAPDADHVLHATSDEPLIAQEMQVTTYHLLWELVHVHLERGDIVAVPTCGTDTHCITCADEAIQVRVLGLLGDGLALVDTGSGTEEISIALVDAGVGDTVLVHASEAIGVVTS